VVDSRGEGSRQVFPEGAVILWVGHKKIGKSFLLLVQAGAMMEAGRGVVYVDTENGEVVRVERLLSLDFSAATWMTGSSTCRSRTTCRRSSTSRPGSTERESRRSARRPLVAHVR
jgi:energy-coupling factor transporter ATP-binding protein EcfA2